MFVPEHVAFRFCVPASPDITAAAIAIDRIFTTIEFFLLFMSPRMEVLSSLDRYVSRNQVFELIRPTNGTSTDGAAGSTKESEATLLTLRCAVPTYCAASDGPPTRFEGAERLPLASSARTKYNSCRLAVGEGSVNIAVAPLAVTRVTKLTAPDRKS